MRILRHLGVFFGVWNLDPVPVSRGAACAGVGDDGAGEDATEGATMRMAAEGRGCTSPDDMILSVLFSDECTAGKGLKRRYYS